MTSVFSNLLVAVITFLAPHLEDVVVRHYARTIVREARKYHVDPLLVTTLIHVETARSWRADIRSDTHDHGLMQIHVSKNSYPHLLGFEWVLFEPATNIRYGLQTLSMWKKYHRKNCDDSKHPYWSHFQWGYRVRNLTWTRKVSKLYNHLIGRFRNGQYPTAVSSLY